MFITCRQPVHNLFITLPTCSKLGAPPESAAQVMNRIGVLFITWASYEQAPVHTFQHDCSLYHRYLAYLAIYIATTWCILG